MCAIGDSLRRLESALEGDGQAVKLLEFALLFVSAIEKEAEAKEIPTKEYLRRLRLALKAGEVLHPDGLDRRELS